MSLTQGDHATRTFDFAPLIQFVGVEGSVPSYPPYDIERTGENAYGILVAVAGFTDADLSIETKENVLTIRGEMEKTAEVLYQGTAA
jgi:molecular chaperone IbpA